MRAKGIAYDTGFVRGGENSRENFDLDLVKRELAIIRDDLHCTYQGCGYGADTSANYVP